MKGLYKRAKQYCRGCDQTLMAIGKKCPVCGVKIVKKQPKPKRSELINKFNNGKIE